MLRSRSTIKRNKRGFPLIRLLGITLICFFLAKALFFRQNSSNEKQRHTTAALLPTPQLPTKRLLPQPARWYVVKPGDTFYSIFSQIGLNGAHLSSILTSFKNLGCSTLYPRDSVVLYKNNDVGHIKIDFFSRLQDKYSIMCLDTFVTIHKEPIPVVHSTYLLNGELVTSLSESMFALGVSDVITAQVADIFAWDINFFIDPRKGDSFQVLFDKKSSNGVFTGYGQIVAAKYTLEGKRTFCAYALADSLGKIRYFDEHGKALQKQFLKAPLSFSRISSTYTAKRKHPVLGIVRPHFGVDYAAPRGTPVYASAEGKVYFAGVKGDYGKLVIVAHGGIYQTYYGHLNAIARGIIAGKMVRQGDLIGTVGATGLATGAHLDYRMKRHGAFVNPLTMESPSLKSVSDEEIGEFTRLRVKSDQLFMHRFAQNCGSFLLEIAKKGTIAAQVSDTIRCRAEQLLNPDPGL